LIISLNCELRIANCELRITNYELRGLPVGEMMQASRRLWGTKKATGLAMTPSACGEKLKRGSKAVLRYPHLSTHTGKHCHRIENNLFDFAHCSPPFV